MPRLLTPVALLLALGLPMLPAEGPNDPAPFIAARGTVTGKKVLFDNTHGETSGQADWVIDGAFSDFANALADNGFYVKELRKASPITLSDLAGYHVLVFGEADIPFKAIEQAALLQYVQNGGAIFFIADHYNADRNKNRWDGSESFNGYRRGAWSNPTKGMSAAEIASAAMQGVTCSDWLGANFGVRFRYNALGNVVANDVVAPAQAFNITAGVATASMHAGSTLAIMDPTKAKGIVYLPPTTAKWANAVDQGVYNGGGRPEGPFVAVAKVRSGKAAFIGDSSPVEDTTPKYLREERGNAKTTHPGWQEQNNAALMVNIVKWLATQESYTALDQVSGLALDTATTLLPMEDPSASTEPLAEPWAAPAAGYLWYDPTTFKRGSYGSSSTVPNTGTATITIASANVTSASGTSATPANPALTDTAPTTGSSLTEGFETGVKPAYSTGDLTFASGIWTFNDALLGTSARDPKSGLQSVRVRNSGRLTMNYNWATGAKTVSVKHARYGTDGNTTWSLWYSTNSGSTWLRAGSAVTTSSTTLATASCTLNITGAIRFEIRKTDGSANRTNFDDFSVVGY